MLFGGLGFRELVFRASGQFAWLLEVTYAGFEFLGEGYGAGLGCVSEP